MENKMQIFSSENFGQLRTVEINGEIYFVGKDVALILGYKDTDKSIRDHVDEEDKRILKPADLAGLTEKQFETMFSAAGYNINVVPADVPNRGLIIINESGLYSLILSSKLPKAKEFKRWVTSEVLPSIRKYGGYFIQPQLLKGNEIQIVKTMADDIQALFAGVRRGIAISKAIDLVSVNNNLNLDGLKNLLPPAEHDTGYLNATEIGEKIGLKARLVNKLLEEKGFQYKENGKWRITYEGAAYGEEIPYTRHGHSDYRILWNKNILGVLRNDY